MKSLYMILLLSVSLAAWADEPVTELELVPLLDEVEVSLEPEDSRIEVADEAKINVETEVPEIDRGEYQSAIDTFLSISADEVKTNKLASVGDTAIKVGGKKKKSKEVAENKKKKANKPEVAKKSKKKKDKLAKKEKKAEKKLAKKSKKAELKAAKKAKKSDAKMAKKSKMSDKKIAKKASKKAEKLASKSKMKKDKGAEREPAAVKKKTKKVKKAKK